MQKTILYLTGFIPLLVIGIGMTACQATVTGRGVPESTEQVRTGYVLKLNREISIPATSASVILQNGQIQGGSSVDRFRASCHIVMQQIKQTSQRVTPDEFIITGVRYWEDFAGFGYRTPLSGPEFIKYEIEMRLHSDKQPNVHSLTCKHDDEDIYGRHLRMSEMQQALGDFAQIIKKTSK